MKGSDGTLQLESTDSAPRGKEVDVIARMTEIASKAEEFLMKQALRLRGVLEHCKKLQQDREALSDSIDRLKAERTQWEKQRQDTIRAIEEERSNLIDAWKRLEVEQRELTLQQQSSAAVAQQPETVALSPEPACPAKPKNSETADNNTTQALDQYERLKRDIRNHAARSRRK